MIYDTEEAIVRYHEWFGTSFAPNVLDALDRLREVQPLTNLAALKDLLVIAAEGAEDEEQEEEGSGLPPIWRIENDVPRVAELLKQLCAELAARQQQAPALGQWLQVFESYRRELGC